MRLPCLPIITAKDRAILAVQPLKPYYMISHHVTELRGCLTELVREERIEINKTVNFLLEACGDGHKIRCEDFVQNVTNVPQVWEAFCKVVPFRKLEWLEIPAPEVEPVTKAKSPINAPRGRRMSVFSTRPLDELSPSAPNSRPPTTRTGGSVASIE